jgi:sugar lactone lactonase YvrE
MKNMISLCAILLTLLIGAGCSNTNSFAPPANITATSFSSNITIKWDSVPNVIGYNVYRGTESGSISAKKCIAAGLTVTHYDDLSAQPGVTYYYQVTAFNSTGDSQPPPEVIVAIKSMPGSSALIGGAIQGSPLTLTNEVTTFAGSSSSGLIDAIGTAAKFNFPVGITTDGTNLYVADTLNHCIRKIDIATGNVTKLAGGSSSETGTTDGIGSAARFNAPYGITTDGINLYVSDYFNHMIRKVVIETGEVTTVAGSSASGSINGIGAAARFLRPRGITTDGTHLYVADSGNRIIRRIVIATGSVSTLAGTGTSGSTDGTMTEASFSNPEDIITDGQCLYLTDSVNNNIRKIDLAKNVVSTLAGSLIPGRIDGIAAAASFTSPSGITTDGTNLYIADAGNNLIRQVVITTGEVTTIAGIGTAGVVNGTSTKAAFSEPTGITTDGISIFITEVGVSQIRRLF